MRGRTNLNLGDAVIVRWTNCGRYYRGRGEVSKINAKTVRVVLTEPVVSYPIGREIIVPIHGTYSNGIEVQLGGLLRRDRS